jgi:chloramphenicol-sensitive protein RarD
MNRGVVLALTAYLLWGAFPLYFKAVQSIPPADMLAHRVLWSALFVWVLLAAQRRWQWVERVFAEPRVLATFTLSAVMVSLNWGVYIYAVSSGHIVDASLGYFINPLMSVMLGALVLRERMRALQWFAIACAAIGVAWLTWTAGRPPWIGLVIAVSFTVYGLLRKTAPLGSMEGLMLETVLIAPVAIGYLAWFTDYAAADTPHAPLTMLLLIAASGPVTAMPLLLFGAAARKIPLSVLGVIQYVAPSLQFVLALFYFREPFDPHKALGYVAIWTGLAVFTAEALWLASRRRNEVTA